MHQQQMAESKIKEKKCLGYGSDFSCVLPVLCQNAFTLIVSGELVDSCFDDLHVAFVVQVLLVFVQVNR
jgi:hypothetical protein